MISRFIDTYLRLNVAEEQRFQTELAAIPPKQKEAVMEVMTSWEERGMVRGLEQGIERGRQQEAATFVLRLLTRRIGSLTAELEEQIKARSIVQLEDLGEALLDFTDATELVHVCGSSFLVRRGEEAKAVASSRPRIIASQPHRDFRIPVLVSWLQQNQ